MGNPTGSSSDSYRVQRGGAWTESASSCRSAYRLGRQPGSKEINLGFRIVRRESKTLGLTSPNGGEYWFAGSSQTITWTSVNVSNVQIDFSPDGLNWTNIVASTPSVDSYTITVPDVSSSNCYIRIVDVSDIAVYDLNDEPFTIVYTVWLGIDGTRYAESTDPGGDIDWYRFNATSGVPYTLETFGSIDLYMELYEYGPYGLTLLFADDDGAGYPNPKIVFTCEESGTYYFLIRGYNSSITGDYEVSVVEYGRAPPQNLQIIDVSFRYISLSWNAPVSSKITPGKEATGREAEIDAMLSAAGLGGYNVYRSTTSGGTGVRLNSSPISSTNYTDTTVSPGTTYYYTVTAVYSDPQRESGRSNEVQVETPQVVWLAVDGTRYAESISPGGDVDWYRFIAAEYVRYTLETFGSTDMVMYLYDRDGSTLIYSNDDGGVENNSKIIWTCPQSGTYYIKLRAWGSITGNYEVSVVESGVPVPQNLEISGITLTSVSLVWDSPISSKIVAGKEAVERESMVDAMLSAAGFSGYNVYRSTTSGGSGVKLNSSPVSGTSYTDNTVSAGNTYYYTVTAVFSDPVMESERSNEVQADVPEMIWLAVDGTTYSASISPEGDFDWYRFNASAGVPYLMETSGTTDMYMELYDRDGVTLIFENDDGKIDLNSRILWRFESSGTYYIRLRGWSSSETGSYEVSVEVNGRPAPQELWVEEIASSYVSLSWEPPVYAKIAAGKEAPEKQTAVGAVQSNEWEIGYNVYRSTTSGGSGVRLNSATVMDYIYTDTTVTAGATYYYTATAVYSNPQRESGRSNEVRVDVPGEAAVTVISPNGGESWAAGTYHDITWTSQSINTVRIAYTTNGGSSWTTITSGTTSDGSYSWIVPEPPSSNCYVMITDTTNSNVTDTSDGPFTITSDLYEPNPRTSPYNIVFEGNVWVSESATISSSDDQDWFSFEGSEGSTVTIFCDVTSDLDPGLVLYYQDENLVTSDMGASGTDEIISDYTLEAAGTYLIGVGYWYSISKAARAESSAGSYTLTVTITTIPRIFTFEMGDVFSTAFAIGDDGTLYVPGGEESEERYWLYALNPDGTVQWQYEMEYQISPPSVGSDGTLYFGSYDGFVYALDRDGNFKWQYFTDTVTAWSSPSLGSDGTLYVGSTSNNMHAIDAEDGSLKWQFETGSTIYSSPALGSDGTVYFGSYDALLYALDSDGTLKWIYPTEGGIVCSPALGSDGTVYFGSADNYVYALNPDGTLKWSYPTDSYVYSSPAIGSDGTVYVGSADYYLYAINSDGTLKWRYLTDAQIYSSPAIGSDGTVYVGSIDTYLYAINSDGTLKERFKTDSDIMSSPALDSDGILYFTSIPYLYALDTQTGAGLADSSWPKMHHDLRNTGSVMPVSLHTIYVATTGNDATGSGTQSNPFRTIQKGIDSASSADTVRVAEGTYQEAIVGKDNVVVEGAGRYNTFIEADYDGNMTVPEGAYTLKECTFTVVGGNVDLQGTLTLEQVDFRTLESGSSWREITVTGALNTIGTLLNFEAVTFRSNSSGYLYNSTVVGLVRIGGYMYNGNQENISLTIMHSGISSLRLAGSSTVNVLVSGETAVDWYSVEYSVVSGKEFTVADNAITSAGDTYALPTIEITGDVSIPPVYEELAIPLDGTARITSGNRFSYLSCSGTLEMKNTHPDEPYQSFVLTGWEESNVFISNCTASYLQAVQSARMEVIDSAIEYVNTFDDDSRIILVNSEVTGEEIAYGYSMIFHVTNQPDNILELSVSVDPDVTVEEVHFYRDDVLFFSDPGAPYYSNNLDISPYRESEHTVQAVVVFDETTSSASTMIPDIQVTSPNGGETLTANSVRYITWQGRNVGNVRIDYSIDGGGDWTPVVLETDAAAGSYPWTVPDVESIDCMVMISSTASSNLMDMSNSTFTIEWVEPPPEDVFNPTTMTLTVPANIQYDFDGSDLTIPYTLEGTPGHIWLVINTKDQAHDIQAVRNGYLGWHYVNKIDTTIYISEGLFRNPGAGGIVWDGRDQDGNMVPAGEYDFYLWSYDNVSERQLASEYVMIGYAWESQFAHIYEVGENGMPLANPIIFGARPFWTCNSHADGSKVAGEPAYKDHGVHFKWVLGGDPMDIAMLQTTRCWIYEVENRGQDSGFSYGGPVLNPHDHNNFFHSSVDYNGWVSTMLKWEFVPDGDAILDTDWGGWDEMVWEQYGDMIGMWSQKPSCYTDGTYIYSVSPGLFQKDFEWNRLRCVSFDGEVVFDKEMWDWFMPDDMNPQGYINGAFNKLYTRGNNRWFLLGYASCLHQMIDTTRLLYDSDDETDMVVFENRNGDYFMDAAYEETVETPWICLSDDREVTMWRDSIAIDSQGFNIIGTSYLGLVSFGVSTQDGTGIGYMAFGDDTEMGDITIKGGGQLCDSGSAYDGLYFSGANQEGALWTDMAQTYFVAFDSAHGVISSTGEPESDVEVVSPNGGESLVGGSTNTITWTCENVAYVKLEYSSDNSASWNTITESVDAAADTFFWSVPDIESSECYVRITDTSNSTTVDMSNSAFSIVQVAFIQVDSPVGGDEWPCGSKKTIRWTCQDVSEVNIAYSTDEGVTWQSVASNVDASAREYEWTIPDEPSSGCKIRITSTMNSSIFGEIDGTFSLISGDYVSVLSPELGNQWTVNSEKEIRWEFSNVSYIKIELSIDDGVTWSGITASVSTLTGAFSWLVPDTPSNTCRIRITDTTRPAVSYTGERFEIIRPETIIYHVPATTEEELQDIDFRTVITSTTEIDSVFIVYRKTGTGNFDNIKVMMPSGAENEYYFVLGAGYFVAPGLEYYIIARDIEGIETRMPEDVGYYSVSTFVQSMRSEYQIDGGGIQSAYRMISIPLNLTATSIEDQVGEKMPGKSGTEWRLFAFPPGGNVPIEYPNMNGFRPGVAFWLITKNNFVLEVPEGTTVPTDAPFMLELKSGWNDIANPWLFDISWDDIENPASANLSELFTYTGEWTDPEDNPIRTILPWKGYAVMNMETSSRVIYLLPNPVTSGKRVVNEEPVVWKLTIKASAGKASDSANHLGIRKNARVEWDYYDHVEPPPIGEYVSVAFPHQDWEEYPYDYTVDFRPPGSTHSWDFDVRTNISMEKVAVTIEGAESLPEGQLVYVFNRDTRTTIPTSEGAFSFMSGTGLTEWHYTLIVSDSDNPELQEYLLKPERFVKAYSYPNPFNPQTTILYELSMAGEVSVRIFNTIGQQVREYKLGHKGQGVHQLTFDASDLTSGMYFYRVDAGYSSVTGKVMLMK